MRIGQQVLTSAVIDGQYHNEIKCLVVDIIGQNLKLRHKDIEFYRPITECLHEEQESAVEFLFRKYMDNGLKLYLSDFIEASNIEDNYLNNKQKPLQ